MSKFLKTSVGTEFQAWGLIWAISFSSFPWCSKNFKPLATKPVGFAADGIAKLLMKDWIPPFCHPWILTALPSSALSSWILWIFLLNSSGVLLGSIALVFLFLFFFSPPNWKIRLFSCWKEAVQNRCPEPRGSAGTERWNSSPQDTKGCWLQRCQKFSSSWAASSVGLCGTCWQTAASETHQYPHLQSCAFCNPQDSVFRCSDDNSNTALVMQQLAI